MQIDVHEHGGKWYISTGWINAADKAPGNADLEFIGRGRFGYRFHWSEFAKKWILGLYSQSTGFESREAASQFLTANRKLLESAPVAESS